MNPNDISRVVDAATGRLWNEITDAEDAEQDAHDRATDELCSMSDAAYHAAWSEDAMLGDWLELLAAVSDRDMDRIDRVRERVEARWIAGRAAEIMEEDSNDH